MASACSLPVAPIPRYQALPARTVVAITQTSPDAAPNHAASIIEHALLAPTAHALLTELCDDIGARPAGSEALERAVQWADTRLREAGHVVRVDPVMVSAWTRGQASLSMLTPRLRNLEVLAIGHSVPTPREGIEADVVVVRSKEELTKLGDTVRDRIVLFEVVMPPYDVEHNDPGYGLVYWSRVHGASLAAKQGARAVLVRSLSANSRSGVHTGTLYYDPSAPRIPAATISTEDADWITRLTERGKTVRVKLALSPKDDGMKPSANVVAELTGREKPEEVVLIGGHLDSWDVGQGAHDDGAGVVIAMEALNLLRRMNLTPRRTIRAVLFTNEEAGGEGGKAYDEKYGAERHVAAIETDTGGTRVVGLGVDLDDDGAEAGVAEKLRSLLPLRRLGAEQIILGQAGSDIGPLIKRGVPGIGLVHDLSHYFDIHHTQADTLDKVDKDELQQGVAVMAVLAYTLADMPLDLR